MKIKCSFCGKECKKKPYDIKRSLNLFCDMKCRHKWRFSTITQRISQDVLFNVYIKQKKSFRQIQKLFNINNRTVSKLLNYYEIPIRYGSEAVATQWINNKDRTQATTERFLDNTRKNRINNQSEPERKCFDLLTTMEIVFEAQFPLGRYILDFYIPTLNLNIEIDGKEHQLKEKKRKDIERDRYIESLGIKVVRIQNEYMYNRKGHVLISNLLLD